jgi:HPt (histidine-containing phosphotransfer) domain-containing protein
MNHYNSTPIINQEQLEMLCMAAEDQAKVLIEDLKNSFVQSWSSRRGELEEACEVRDSGGLRKVAHALSGSAGNLGLGRLASICREIEMLIDSKGEPEYEFYPGLIVRTYEASISELEEYISKIGS